MANFNILNQQILLRRLLVLSKNKITWGNFLKKYSRECPKLVLGHATQLSSINFLKFLKSFFLK